MEKSKHKVDKWLISLSKGHSPNFKECLMMLGDYFPLLHQFHSTEQDPQWHAEGDVAIHTDMVLKSLYEILSLEADTLKGEKRQILILAALLHDIAKPLTTKRKEINGVERVVAPKHEEIGASYLATRLPKLHLSQNCIESVMALVSFHQVPKLLVVKNRSIHDYLQLALNVDLELVYWLEIADMKGRECPDLDKQLDLLEQFRMFAMEYDLWQSQDLENRILGRIKTNSQHNQQIYLDGYGLRQLASGDIHLIEEAPAKFYEPCQNYSHLYVMCGISGSGKSSWINKHLDDFYVISLDEIRAEINGQRECQKNVGKILHLAKQRLKTALGQKRNVVWDATNIRKDFRDVICQLGLQYGALITVVAFQITEPAVRANNKNRKHVVPDDVISQQIEKLQWPIRTEGHRMLVVGENGVELSRQGSF